LKIGYTEYVYIFASRKKNDMGFEERIITKIPHILAKVVSLNKRLTQC
jgi:hypothetical protein